MNQNAMHLLGLVGESYLQYRDTFVSLEEPVDWKKLLIADATTTINLEILLDCSGSMADPLSGGVKMEIAKQAVQSFVAKLPEGTRVGLRAFGHQGSGAEPDKAISGGETELIY